jgi:hypothetical protein
MYAQQQSPTGELVSLLAELAATGLKLLFEIVKLVLELAKPGR